jgi:hypothetical protein
MTEKTLMATMIIQALCEERSAPNSRKRRRSSVSLPALIAVSGNRHSAKLLNLSTHGAMIHSSAPATPEDQVILSCGVIEAQGRVVWTSDECFGIEFHSQIDENEVVRQLYRSNAIVDRSDQREAGRANPTSARSAA